MTAQERIDVALHAPDPRNALRLLVQEFAKEGRTKTETYSLFEKCLLELRARPNSQESDEDPILDVMDALSGWCHPSKELLREKPA